MKFENGVNCVVQGWGHNKIIKSRSGSLQYTRDEPLSVARTSCFFTQGAYFVFLRMKNWNLLTSSTRRLLCAGCLCARKTSGPVRRQLRLRVCSSQQGLQQSQAKILCLRAEPRNRRPNYSKVG